jgi:hypothetical protein
VIDVQDLSYPFAHFGPVASIDNLSEPDKEIRMGLSTKGEAIAMA